MHLRKRYKGRGLGAGLVGGMALSALAGMPAAGQAAHDDAAKLETLTQQVEILQQQIDDLKASQASRHAEGKRAADASAKLTIKNGRPTISSADGNYSMSLRSLVQSDAGSAVRDGVPGGTALSSGVGFRRARLGVAGRLGGVFSYSFIYDFAGGKSSISQAYLQYDGLKPVVLRVGAFAPYASLEDSGGAANTLFLERATVVDIARGVAGADGRAAVAITAAGKRSFASLAYTGGTIGQSASLSGQQAVLGRLAGLFYDSADAKIVAGVNGSCVFHTARAAGGAPVGTTLAYAPEYHLSGTSLVSSGAISADRVTQWGIDGAAQWKSVYAEGGYFGFAAARRGTGLAGSDPDFAGWYAQASWILTGERRRYSAARAAFLAPDVAAPFAVGAEPGWGAWEAAVRYSTLDLNYHSALSTADGGIRGGKQDIWTFGVNWYPSNVIRISLNYLLIHVARLSQGTVPPFSGIGQNDRAVALRSQISL